MFMALYEYFVPIQNAIYIQYTCLHICAWKLMILLPVVVESVHISFISFLVLISTIDLEYIACIIIFSVRMLWYFPWIYIMHRFLYLRNTNHYRKSSSFFNMFYTMVVINLLLEKKIPYSQAIKGTSFVGIRIVHSTYTQGFSKIPSNLFYWSKLT